MSRLVQCIPNFSEGRRPEVLAKIVEAIDKSSNVSVIDYSMDPDHNRAVVTFIGAPEDIRVSMLAGARVAVDLIDLNFHTGGHPRIGAVDVVPVVALEDMSQEEIIELGHDIGRDIAVKLDVPVYYYEDCALRNQCKNLADVRRGGFEALKARGLIDGCEPDVGPGELHPTAGASVVGARGPLIAFNVNLKSNNISIAKKIAARIRHMRGSGEAMEGVKAIGVELTTRGIVQVSTNITKPDLVSMWDVFDMVQKEAKKLGVEVLESELIGAIRRQALMNTVRSAIKLPDLTEKRVI